MRAATYGGGESLLVLRRFPARIRRNVMVMYSGEYLLPIHTLFTLFLDEIEKGLVLGFQWPTSFEEIKVKNL